MRSEGSALASFTTEEFYNRLLRMTVRASCMASVFTFLPRIVREHFQFTPIVLASKTFAAGASELLYIENVRLSQSVSRVLGWAPVCHEVSWRELASHS